jgi:uncharacterized protein (TIGR02147 family)
MTIYSYTDYRLFLGAYLTKLPHKGRGEVTRMAQAIGVTPSLLSQVLSESKNLNLEQAQELCEYLELTSHESEHFLLMVQYQRAGTKKLGDYFKKKLQLSFEASIEVKQKVRQDKNLTDNDKALFYSHWLYVAIWLFTSIGKGKSLEDVASEFKLSREEASKILHFLTNTGLTLYENEKYTMGPQSIYISRESPHLIRHHTNWRLRAIEACDKITTDEMIVTAPISLSESDFKKVRARLSEVLKEVVDTAIASDADRVACFNLDFFWVRPDR